MPRVTACRMDDVDPEDVIRFDHAGATHAICRDRSGAFHATDGLCTHERVHLSGGLVIGDTIECPKHNGRFNYKTGQALRAPVRMNLRVYPVRLADGRVEISID